MDEIPILDAQYLFLMMHKIIGGTPLVYSFKIKIKPDQTAFNQAVRSLFRANPILQQRFLLPKNSSNFSDFIIKNEESSDLPIVWEDLSSLESNKQKDKIEIEYNKLLNKQTDLAQDPLCAFHVLKLNENEIHLLTSIAHVISDGLSSLQILNELLKCLSGEDVKVVSQESYNQIALKLNAYQPTYEKLEQYSAWNANLKKISYHWNPNKSKINTFTPVYKTLSSKLTQSETQKLVALAQRVKISLYSMIVCAYIDYFFSITTDNIILLTLPTSGKIFPEIDASEFPGCFAQALTLAFDREMLDKPFEDKLKTVNDAIHGGIQAEFDLIQNQKTAHSIKKDFKLVNGELTVFRKTVFRLSIKSNIYISFTGYSPLKQHYNSLEISDYKEGTFNNSGVSDWMHTILNGELHIFGNYDTLFFEEDVINGVLANVCKILGQYAQSPTNISNEIAEISKFENDPGIAKYLIDLCASIGLNDLNLKHFRNDLEGELGLDSLGRIRLIAKIAKDHGHKIQKNILFDCRTLEEFAHKIQISS